MLLDKNWVLPCFIFFEHRSHFKTFQVFKALAPDILNVLRLESAEKNTEHSVKKILMHCYMKKSRWQFRAILERNQEN